MENKQDNSNLKLAFSILLLAVGMLFFAFASAPLYNLFCKATGFAGTPQIAVNNGTKIGKRMLTIRFDANVEPNLPWRFWPVQKEVKLYSGENGLAFYGAENMSSSPVVGTAVYNVTPTKVGQYFNKIQCFCFEDQLLAGGQKMQFPVAFFIDPAIEDDKDARDVDTITLSYSFYRVK